jgi:hypothetical protein
MRFQEFSLVPTSRPVLRERKRINSIYAIKMHQIHARCIVGKH